MSLAVFSFTERVRPIVELGLGVTPRQVGTAVWDTAIWDELLDTWVGPDQPPADLEGRWSVAFWGDGIAGDGLPSPADPGFTDAGDAHWSGFEPEFYDVTCDTISVEFGVGRARTTDRFEVGFASIVLSNESGRYDMRLPAPPPGAVLSLVPGRAIRVGVEHLDLGTVWLWRGYIDEVVPSYDPVEHDVLTVNAIDALGEVGRVDIAAVADPGVGSGESATNRIRRILAAAQWWLPDGADIGTAATAMLPTTLGASAADLLSVTAESEGGATFGDARGRVAFRMRDWQSFDAIEPADASVGNVNKGEPGYWIPGVPQIDGYLSPTVGWATTPDAADLTINADRVWVWKFRSTSLSVGTDQQLGGRWNSPTMEHYVAFRPGQGGLVVSASTDGTTGGTFIRLATNAEIATAFPDNVDSYLAVRFQAGVGWRALRSTDGTTWTLFGTPSTTSTVTALFNSTVPLNVGTHTNTGGTRFAGRIYWAEMRTGLDPVAGSVVWRLDPNDYVSGTTWTDPRGRAWTVTTAAAITPKIPAVPDEWVPPVPPDVCPTGLELAFRRGDIVTRTVLARTVDTVPRVIENRDAIAMYGHETYEATDLICQDPSILNVLGLRVLRTRSPEIQPRVEAVTFDASTGEDVIDLISVSDPRTPSRWTMTLDPGEGPVLSDRDMFVTGMRHVMERDSWTVRYDLDLAWPYAISNPFRWSSSAAGTDVGHWGRPGLVGTGQWTNPVGATP